MKWDCSSKVLNNIFNIEGKLFTVSTISNDSKFIVFLDHSTNKYIITESITKKIVFSDVENNDRVRDMDIIYFQNSAMNIIADTLKVTREQILSFECVRVLDYDFIYRIVINAIILTLPEVVKRPPVQEIMDV